MFSKIKAFLENLLFSIQATYRAAHRYFILKIFFSLSCSLLPFFNLILWKNVINALLYPRGTETLTVLLSNIAAYLAVYFLVCCLTRASEYVNYKYNDMVGIYVENILLDKFANVDLAFYDSSEYANKLSHTWEIKNAMTMLAAVFFNSFQTIFTFIVSLVLLSQLHPLFTVVILLLCVPVFLFKIKSNRISQTFSEESAQNNRELSYFKNLFRGTASMYDIKLYNLKDFFISKYFTSWTCLYKKRKELTLKLGALSFVGLLLSTFINQFLLYGIVIRKLMKKAFQIGDATYFMSLYTQFQDSLTGLIGMIGNVQYAYSQLVTIREFINSTPAIQKSGTLSPADFESLCFDHISFTYPGKEENVLEDCSFTICRGETVGLVGENGSGKSTIAKLILRLYDVDKGRILLNGIDIREYDITMYRAMVSALFQDFIEYSFTVRENIALSDYARMEDDEGVWDAIRKSELQDVVKNWSKGLETPLTRDFEPDGKELSGGQWQRVALARVFFADRKFVVLDEPSAALDVFAEEKIFKQFENLSDRRTSVIISHRLSSIVNANKIIVLKDGRIIEEGTHKDLIQKKQYYAELFELQASRYYTVQACECGNSGYRR